MDLAVKGVNVENRSKIGRPELNFPAKRRRRSKPAKGIAVESATGRVELCCAYPGRLGHTRPPSAKIPDALGPYLRRALPERQSAAIPVAAAVGDAVR